MGVDAAQTDGMRFGRRGAAATMQPGSPAEAGAVLEELEETARLGLMYRPAPLTADQIAELRQHSGARW